MIGELAAAHWVATGLRASAAMVWMTWWPLIFGFILAGLLQSLAGQERWRARLGGNGPEELAVASLLGALSSSCSYAASALARALFARGASWRNAVVFMIASTNLVIELGVVIAVMLGRSFVAAQLIGGVIMIALVALLVPFVWRPTREERLLALVRADPPPDAAKSESRLRVRERFATAARYTLGDLAMIRKELLAGFLIAGFLSAHVPSSWWRDLLYHGHGSASLVENVVLAPLLASLSSVCSVGNVPLAATLWAHGVAFGAVVSFILADLIAVPLLMIYRRFYGAGTMVRLFVVLWLSMSLAGAAVNALFDVWGLTPTSHAVRALRGRFPLGLTLALNIVATIALVLSWWLARRRPVSGVATDPICGMSVDVTSPAATLRVSGETIYFCSPRCKERYLTRANTPEGSAEH